MSRVWPNITVDESSLRQHVAALRKALGEGQPGVRYVTNVQGRGYCFVAPIGGAVPVGTTPTTVVEPAITDKAHRLPARLTRMIGRDESIRAICEQLAEQRFVTILGPGGIGKTTVAVSIGHQRLADFEGAVRFFDLGPLNDPRLVPSTLASTLGLLVQSSDPTPSLIGFLQDKRMLLILDSCEHVVDTAAALAERVFVEAPQVHILATSRESLRVEGEHVYRLPALESPPEGVELTAAQTLAFPAAQLFVERAGASAHRFELTDADAPIVAEMCRKLDGIALAIELAAGRVDVHGIQETAILLNKRFNLLWQGRRSAPPRHRTLRATLDWSYDLLPELERVFFRRLSVFVGYFTLEAARSVAAGGDIEPAEVEAVIASLVAKSLVTADTGRRTTRYRLLDATRAYLLGKLAEQDEGDRIARNHAIYYRELLERSDLNSPAISDAMQLDNVRVALEWSLSERGDIELGTALAAASGPLLIGKSQLVECHAWAERAIAALDDTTRGTRREMELQAALGMSLMFSESNNENARIALTRGLSIAVELDDLTNQLRFLERLHNFSYRTGAFRTLLELAFRSEAVAKKQSEPAAIAAAHTLLGISQHIAGDVVTARAHLEAALAEVSESSGLSTFHLGLHYRNRASICLARTLWLLGYSDQANKVARRTIEEAESLNHPLALCIALIWAVTVFLWIGEWASAEETVGRLVEQARRRSIVPYESAGLGVAGYLCVKRGYAEAGIPLLRDSLAALHARRYELLTSLFNGALAEGLAMVGRFDEALQTIDETIALVERNGDLFNMPELLRIKGQILITTPGADPAQAEDCFLESLKFAGQRSLLALELRAGTSLAHLWSKQGRVDEARNLLGSICRKFSEGFRTVDFEAAQYLLSKLNDSAAAVKRN